jgi:hypothetical protein
LEAIGEASHRLAAKTIAVFGAQQKETYDRASSISCSFDSRPRYVSQISDGIHALTAVSESPPHLKAKRSNAFEWRDALR